MKLYYILSCILIYCRASSIAQNTITEKSSMYSRQVGPKYGKSEMSLGSLISALYSIPCVQEALYEEKYDLYLGAESTCSEVQKSFVMFMTDSFLKMSENSWVLNLKNDQEDIGFQAVDLQLLELLKSSPENFKNLFSFNMKIEIFKHFTSVIIHHAIQERLHKNIRVDSNLTSVADQIRFQFSDNLSNEAAKQKMKINFPVQVKHQVQNHPKVFTLFLNRIVQTSPNVLDSFTTCPFTIDKEIDLNNVSYILISRIEYNAETGFYSTVALDLGNSKNYRYDENGNVTEFIDVEPLVDTNSVVLFYIPKPDSQILEYYNTAKGKKRKFEEISGSQPEKEKAAKARDLDFEIITIDDDQESSGSVDLQDIINQYFMDTATDNQDYIDSFDNNSVEDFNTSTYDSNTEALEHVIDEISEVSLKSTKVRASDHEVIIIDDDQESSDSVDFPETTDITNQELINTTKSQQPIDAQEISSTSTVQDTAFFRPNYENLTHEERMIFLDIEKHLRDKIGIWPDEILDFYAKFAFETFTLGNQQWSFKIGPYGQICYALEIFLTCLASNSKAVMRLFESPKAVKDVNSVEYHLVIVIVKMLLGCKNISLDFLVSSLLKNDRASLVTYIDMESKDFEFRNCFRLILSVVDPSIISVPTINTIKYYGMLSDDPISIRKESVFSHIKLNEVIEQREATIKGLWYDSIDGTGTSNRIRSILKATSEIVVVEVERWINEGQSKVFNPKSIELNSVDYECIGVVTLPEKANNFGSLFIDNFSGNTFYRYLVPGKQSVSYKVCDLNKVYFQEACKKESVLLFFSKKSDQNPLKMFSKHIPYDIFKNSLNDIAKEHDLDIDIDSNK